MTTGDGRILRIELLQLVVCRERDGGGCLRFIILVEEPRTGNVACFLCLQLLLGDEGGREYRVLHDLEEAILLVFGKSALDALHLRLQLIVGVEITLQLIAKLARVELGVAVWHRHVSWLTDAGQAVVFRHQGEEALAEVVAKLLAEPFL